jgi:hypothetical protein
MLLQHITKWYVKFMAGRNAVTDDACSGCLSITTTTVNAAHIGELIHVAR